MSGSEAMVGMGRVQLSEDDVAYLMNLLRNTTQPVTTQQLIDALRRQATQSRPAADAAGS